MVVMDGDQSPLLTMILVNMGEDDSDNKESGSVTSQILHDQIVLVTIALCSLPPAF